MIFDAMKIIKNTYSCAISGMSKEMMKMDGRDRAECQNWEKRDINVILRKVFKSLDDKNEQCRLLKWAVAGAESGNSSCLRFLKFFFRERATSL